MDESHLDNRDEGGAARGPAHGGWWTYLAYVLWVAGVAYLFWHLKWGKPTDHPWTRFTSALTLRELLTAISFFAAALLIHHHANEGDGGDASDEPSEEE